MAAFSTIFSFLYALPGMPCEGSCTVAQPPYAVLSGIFIAILIIVSVLAYLIFRKKLPATTASLTKKIGTGLLLVIVTIWAIGFYVPVKTAVAPPGCANPMGEYNEGRYCICTRMAEGKQRLSLVKGENIFEITDLEASGKIPSLGDQNNVSSHYCIEGAVYQQYLF